MPQKSYRGLMILLLCLGVPLFLITTNLNIVINSGWLYTVGFERHKVADRTGIKPQELRGISDKIKDYFNNDDDRLDVVAIVNGTEIKLFNEREISHMIDVKRLVRGISFWQLICLGTMLGVLASGLFVIKTGDLRVLLARGLLAGSVFTVAVFAVAAVGSLIGFDTLFERFHLISFSNDLWRLDPATDHLVRIFPQAFFLEATLIIAALTVGQAVLLGSLACGYLWKRTVPEGKTGT